MWSGQNFLSWREYLGGQGEPFFMVRLTTGAVCDIGAWGGLGCFDYARSFIFQKEGRPKPPSLKLGSLGHLWSVSR